MKKYRRLPEIRGIFFFSFPLTSPAQPAQSDGTDVLLAAPMRIVGVQDHRSNAHHQHWSLKKGKPSNTVVHFHRISSLAVSFGKEERRQ